MTELPGAPEARQDRFLSWRKLVYLMLAAGVAAVVAVWFPAEKTARFAWRVAPGTHTELQVTLPAKCRVSACYLRGKTPLPESAAPLTLQCDDVALPVGPLKSLTPAAGKTEPGAVKLLLPLELAGKKTFTLRQIAVDPALEDAAELVIEITGPAETVAAWPEIVRLKIPPRASAEAAAGAPPPSGGAEPKSDPPSCPAQK